MKKLNLELEGQDGNVFSLMGYFSHEAKRAGWTDKEIHEVLDEAQKGDYDHALQTLMKA